MNMLKIHEAALSSYHHSYHEFLSRYKKGAKVVYGFVEGKEDPSFYNNFIEAILPNDWEIELWGVGGKDNVLEIHKNIDWRSFKKNQIAFFIDKDLTSFLPEKIIKDSNIYITDKYSIENSIVNRRTCNRVLSEICGFHKSPMAEKEKVLDLFEVEFEKFLKEMVSIMSWIIEWKKNGEKPCLDDICMNHLFQFTEGKIFTIKKPKRCDSQIAYIHKQCNIAHDSTHDISSTMTLFGKKKYYRNYTRGKYVMWFLIQFCISIHENHSSYFKGLKNKPKMNISLSHLNALILVGTRARCPDSLRIFLTETYSKHINDD